MNVFSTWDPRAQYLQNHTSLVYPLRPLKQNLQFTKPDAWRCMTWIRWVEKHERVVQLVLNKANDGIFSTASHVYVGLKIAEACLRYKHRLYLLISGAVSTVMFPNDSWTMLDKTFLASCKHEKTKKTKIRLGNQTYNPCTLSKIWLCNTGESLASLKPSVGLLPKCNLNTFAVVGMGQDFEAMTNQCKARSQSSPKRVASANEVVTSSQSSNTSWFVMIQLYNRMEVLDPFMVSQSRFQLHAVWITDSWTFA